MNFSVILDRNYVNRLETLIISLSRYENTFTFYVVALDQYTFDLYKNKKNCFSIHVDEVIDFYPDLIKLQKERDSVSFIFTLSPFFPSYIFERFSDINYLCTLDVDQYFFSSPKPIFDLLNEFSIIITPHRFSKRLLQNDFEKYGKYNVSFQLFKKDIKGLECLKLWRDQCVEWCFDRVENGLYADQKYLDFWKKIFNDNLYEINNKGIGFAPWNFEDTLIVKKKGSIYVDDDKLILFHYQGLKILNDGLVYTYLDNYSYNNISLIHKYIYKTIIRNLLKNTMKKDDFSRNNRIFDEKFLLEKSNFIFKRKFRIIFHYVRYMFIKSFIDGNLIRVKNLFR